MGYLYRLSLHARRHGYDCSPGKCKTAWRKTAAPGRQRGISLFIVLVILLLALIIVLGGLAVANLNEALTGNQSDAQRAYGAAQALINAAELDIRLNGYKCNAESVGGGATGVNSTIATASGVLGAPCTRRFPQDIDTFNTLQSMVGLGNCSSDKDLRGVCFSSGPNDTNFLVDKKGTIPYQNLGNNNGSKYGDFTGSVITPNYGGSAQTGSGVSLAIQGQYWIEIFLYANGNINTSAIQGYQGAPIPVCYYPFIFRITAIANGIKSGTQSVLRTYYVPYASTGKGCG